MQEVREFLWEDQEQNRPLAVHQPCPCGSCMRLGAGYISGSDAAGRGFTVWIDDEEVFDRLRVAFRRRKRVSQTPVSKRRVAHT
jgi:hypothetical protein